MGKTYFLYLARRTVTAIAALLIVIWTLIVSIDLIESMREVGKIEGAGFGDALRMTMFRTPQLLVTLSPFVFLFATLWAFGQMAKTSEIAVMRAAGLSVWRLVTPPVTLALVCGIITVTALDPLAAQLAGRAQLIKNEIRGKEGNLVKEFRNGIWMRQETDTTFSLIRANAYDPISQKLARVTVLTHDTEGAFLERWDAEWGDVTPDAFHLLEARKTTLDGEPVVQDVFRISVPLDMRLLREDVAKPEALSVWQLLAFAERLETIGAPTTRYHLRFHELWSLPLKLAAMVLIACTFSIGMNARSGGAAGLLGIGIGAGFALFILSRLSTAVADAQIVPIALAAWAPGLLAVLTATSILLYREDG